MTEYSRISKNGLIHIQIIGHAEQSDVCRSVSTLVNVFFQCLLWLESEKIIKIQKMNIGSGKSEISFVNNAKNNIRARERLRTTIDVIEIGFMMLQKSFPKCVRFLKTEGEI